MIKSHTANVLIMEIWLYVIITVLVITVIALSIKIIIAKKAIKEIDCEFHEHLENETNTQISISSHDKDLCHLANSINIQLGLLCDERHRFQQGDMELKTAITNISHDLRTPLTAICGYLELLEKEEKSDDAQRYFEIIKSRTEILKKMTEEFFRYTVMMTTENDFNSEEVVLNSVLEECIAGHYAALKSKGIEPTVNISQTKSVRILNREALSRVFGNIINNALKYSDGDLSIILSDGGKISFENTASGLDDVQVGKLFDRFYTVEAARKSTGLGLSIAKTFVEQMKGKINAEYKNGKLKILIEFPENNEN